MPFVDVNGAHIHYEEQGSGRPLVLAHGGWTGLEAWGDNVGPISKHCRVVVYDRRDCGQSTCPPDSNSADAWVEDMRQLMLALDIGRGFVGGLSYGAVTALELCLRHPDMVQGLILASGTSRGIEGSRPGMVSFPSREHELYRVEAPTLILQGVLDPMFTPAIGQELHAGILDSTFVLVQNAGHSLQLDQPAVFNRAVIDFLHRIG